MATPIYDWKRSIEPIFPPVLEQEIVRIEEELKVELPQELKDFLAVANGAFFPDGPEFRFIVPVTEDRRGFEVAKLTTICGIRPPADEVDTLSLDWAQHSYGFRDSVPRKYVAMGSPLHHAVLCMSVEGDDRGAVFLWDPPLIGEEFDPPTAEFVYPAARNLSEFLESLRPADDPA